MTNSFQNSKLNAKNRSTRTLQIESLENRELLSVVPPFAGADFLTQSVPAFTSSINPADIVHNMHTNQESAAAPFEVELETPLIRALPTPTALAGSASTVPQISTEPLVVNLETPQEPLAPATKALSANSTQTIVVTSATQTALKNAISQAPEGATITFDKSLDGANIVFTDTITINKGITIDATNLDSLTFTRKSTDGSGYKHQFIIKNTSATVKLAGITFKENVGLVIEDGETIGGYIGIETQNFKGNLMIEDCFFDANCAYHILSKDNCNITVRRTNFNIDINSINSFGDNTSTSIVIWYGNLLVEDCNFKASAWHHISGNNGAFVKLYRTTFTPYNTSNGKCVALRLYDSTLDMTDCKFRYCNTVCDSQADSNITARGCEFYQSGKIYGGDILLERCLFKKSKGTLFTNATVECYSCIFDSNKASSSSMLFHLYGNNVFTNCTFCNNESITFEGGSSSKVTISNSIYDKAIGTSGITLSTNNCVQTRVDANYCPTSTNLTVNKGNNSYYPASSWLSQKDYYGSPRVLDGKIDIGAVESFAARARSTTSNKVNISWDDYGVESYTVKYKLDGGTDGNWTSAVVKGKTNLAISVKANQEYQVVVIPKGMENKEYLCQSTYGVALGKLTAKVVNKTDNSISFQISNIASLPEMGFRMGIKTQNEKNYQYYDFYKNNNGYTGPFAYSFQGDILTITGLTINTKYNFQFAQERDGGTWYDTHSLSPYTNVSAATNSLKVTKIVVNTLDDTVNNDRYTSLREAIQKAADGAVITFASSLKGQTINLSRSLSINKNITIDASSLYDTKYNIPKLTLKMGTSNTYSIVINGSKNVTINGVKFTSANGNGFGVHCTGKTDSVFNIQNCTFHNLKNALGFEGNAKSAIVYVNNCTFSYVSVHGMFNLSSGRMNVTNCHIFSCSGLVLLNNSNSSLYVNKTNFENNYRICDNYSSAEFSQCKFFDNYGYVICNTGSGVARFFNVLVVDNDFDEDWFACFMNQEQGCINIENMTSADNKRTFRNDGSNYGIRVYNSVCSTKNYGSSSIYQSNCITFTNSGLDDNYRPTANSPCVDAGTNSYTTWTDKDLAGNARFMGSSVDIGCYEYLPVETRTSTSGKTTIYWGDAGVASYTVQYRCEDSDKWTTKTVKNKNELTISVKNNMLYEVLVTPEGSDRNENNIILTGALSKPIVKLVNKTNNSLSYQISYFFGVSNYFEVKLRLGIKKPNEKDYTYYDIDRTDSGYLGSISYSFDMETLTISGLNSNTKYDFQIANYIDMRTTFLGDPSYAISTYTKMSAVTTK